MASTRTFLITTSFDRVVLVGLPREHDVDVVARQHETGDTLDVVDADGDRLHAVAQHRRERRALARAGDLGGEDRFVGIDRHEHDALARREVGNLDERAGGQRVLRPRHFAQRARAELVAEPQRLARDHDRARRQASRLRCASRLRMRCFGLVVEPGLRQEYRDQPEQDRQRRSSRRYWCARLFSLIDASGVLCCSRRVLVRR